MTFVHDLDLLTSKSNQLFFGHKSTKVVHSVKFPQVIQV